MNKLTMHLNPDLQTVTKQLEFIRKRLKYNGRQTVYKACMIGQCLSQQKQIYNENKKFFMHATKHLFTISHAYFFIDLFNLVTIYDRVSCISLPSGVVRENSN